MVRWSRGDGTNTITIQVWMNIEREYLERTRRLSWKHYKMRLSLGDSTKQQQLSSRHVKINETCHSPGLHSSRVTSNVAEKIVRAPLKLTMADSNKMNKMAPKLLRLPFVSAPLCEVQESRIVESAFPQSINDFDLFPDLLPTCVTTWEPIQKVIILISRKNPRVGPQFILMPTQSNM